MLNENYDFATANTKTILNCNLIFLLSYKFDVDAGLDKEAARGDELVNVFQSLG